MEKLFKAVRKDDIDTVRDVLDKNPALIAAVRKPPPKKDAGQQPLGIALKTGHYEIARLLLERGADVNFIEDESISGRHPVINDAIEAAIATSLFSLPNPEKTAASLATLHMMLERGADATAAHPDSGWTPLWWAMWRLQYRVRRGRGLKREHVAGISAIFRALFDAGADPDAPIEWVRPGAPNQPPLRTHTTVREYLAARTSGIDGKLTRCLLAILDGRQPDEADLEA